MSVRDDRPLSPEATEALKDRLYAALKHEKGCSCGRCSGGLNAVDSLVAEIVRLRDEGKGETVVAPSGVVHGAVYGEPVFRDDRYHVACLCGWEDRAWACDAAEDAMEWHLGLRDDRATASEPEDTRGEATAASAGPDLVGANPPFTPSSAFLTDASPGSLAADVKEIEEQVEAELDALRHMSYHGVEMSPGQVQWYADLTEDDVKAIGSLVARLSAHVDRQAEDAALISDLRQKLWQERARRDLLSQALEEIADPQPKVANRSEIARAALVSVGETA